MPRVHVRAKPGRNLQLYYVCPLTGRDITRTAGTDNWEEAKRLAVKWELQLDDTSTPVGKCSWETFRLKFIDEHTRHLAPKSQSIYLTALNAFQKHIGCPKVLAEVTPAVLSTFRARIAAEQVSPSTVATYLRHLQSALAWAKEIGLLKEAPKIKLPRKIGKEMKGRPLTKPEFAQLRRAAADHAHLKKVSGLPRFLRLLWLSGLRIGEARKLSWNRGHIRVDLDTGRRPRIEFASAGQKSRRAESMPITPALAAWLRLTPPEQRHGLVAPLVYESGRAISLDRASKLISATGEAAQIAVKDNQFATAHDLRRSFGTRWAMKVRPITLQRMMRHASITTTLQFYVDLDCDDVGDELWK